ncbi:MAG: 2-oxoacid:acceptor oxidoreductase family protein, partial [Candidatus Binatia bacterium]
MAVPPPETGLAEQSKKKRVEDKERVVIRFAGDSGDGMQLTGMQFTTESALAGNDVGTLPDFPAEIRAPAGTLAGVSAFQLNFASNEVFTPGDDVDVLVAMNPAALHVNIGDLKPGGALIVNTEAFNEQNLQRAGYASNPLEDGSLDRFQIFKVDVTKLTTNALQDLGLSNREALRCKNFFALGLVSWLYHRPIDSTVEWVQKKFAKSPTLAEANLRALRTGYNYGETTEMFAVSY